MTRPVWKPHQVRDQINTITQQQRVYQNFRTLTPVPNTGPGQGLPTFAALSFHWPTWAGSLTTTASDKKTVRWTCNIVAAVIDVTTFTNTFTIQVLLNGVLIPGLSCQITGAGLGQRFVCNPQPIIAYSDGLQVKASAAGTSNTGIITTLEAI